MSELDFESRLGGQLRVYAHGGVRPIDRYAIAEATVASGSGRPGFRVGRPRWLTTRSSRRMTLILAVAATVLAVVGGALLLSAGHPPAPTPSLAPTGHPSVAPSTPPSSPSVSVTSGYEAIFLRPASGTSVADFDIVAVRSDGRERLVRTLSSSMLPDGRTFGPYASVSLDGWIAVHTEIAGTSNSDAFALIKLGDPARAPLLVPYEPVIGGAWGPRGLFATVAGSGWLMRVVDAETGATSLLRDLDLEGGGPDIIWASDGSGLLVRQPDNGSGITRDAIAPVGGGPARPGVPALDWHGRPRYLIAGGTSLWFCQNGGNSNPCDKTTHVAVLTQDVLGTVTEWYSDELAPATLVDASFSADGRSVWLLLDRLDGARHVAVIARADTPGNAHTVATVDLGPGVTHMWFYVLAPDDTTVAIGSWIQPGGVTTMQPPMLVTTANGAASAHIGNLVGFVPGSLPDAWPGGGTFSPAPGATRPPAIADPSDTDGQ